MTVTMPGSPWSCVKGAAAYEFSCAAQKILGPFSKITAQGSVSIDQQTLKKTGCRLFNLAGLPSGQLSLATINVKVGVCGPLPGAISNLKLTKTADPACISVGDQKFNCTFKIDIENTGPGVYAGGQVIVRENFQANGLDAAGMNMVGGTFASAPSPFSDMPLDIGALKKGEHYSGTVVLKLEKDSCGAFNSAEITVPAGRTPFNGDDSDDSGWAGMIAPTQACAMLTNHVVTKKKNDSPRCTPGYNFRAQERTCAPAIVTASNTPPVQQCPPGFNLDQNSRCVRGAVTVPTTIPTVPPPAPAPASAQTSCPPGMTGTPPNCFPPCPPRTSRIGRNCVADTCPAGTTGTPPSCQPAGTCIHGGTPPNCLPGPCPPGTYGTPPNCIGRCPDGQVGAPPNCRPAKCPDGQVGTPPDCRPIAKTLPCPAGTTGPGRPDCQPIAKPKPVPNPRLPRRDTTSECPFGQTGTPPDCKRILPRAPQPGAPPVVR